MAKKVLIVDDNREMLLSLKDGLERFNDSFSLTIAVNGLQAVKILKEEAISLVVTDLKMPRMDGFALLTHIMEHYPDIAVIMMTAYSTPEMKNMARHGGAVGYIEKPFMIEDLARKMIDSLGKTAEGGTLHSVSSGIFLQFIEMEERTCTIRLTDRDSGRQGVLFFRKGELIGARTENRNGEKAAYEIFAWDKTSLSIQNDCLQKKRTIHNDLQAIFLDALLIKDEKDDEKHAPDGTVSLTASKREPAEKRAPDGTVSVAASKREPAEKTPEPKPKAQLKRRSTGGETRAVAPATIKSVGNAPPVRKKRFKTIPAAVQRALEDAAPEGGRKDMGLEEIGPDDFQPAEIPLPEETVSKGGLRNLKIREAPEPYGKATANGLPGKTAVRDFPYNPRTNPAPRPNAHNRAEGIRRKVRREIGDRSGLKDVYPDPSWDGLIVEFEKIGSIFNAGKLKVGHVDKGAAVDYILIPGPETTVASVSSNCPRETMMQVLGDE